MVGGYNQCLLHGRLIWVGVKEGERGREREGGRERKRGREGVKEREGGREREREKRGR